MGGIVIQSSCDGMVGSDEVCDAFCAVNALVGEEEVGGDLGEL